MSEETRSVVDALEANYTPVMYVALGVFYEARIGDGRWGRPNDGWRMNDTLARAEVCETLYSAGDFEMRQDYKNSQRTDVFYRITISGMNRVHKMIREVQP